MTKIEISIVCPSCGNDVELKLIGGQYQNSFRGNCLCGSEWLLIDVTEDGYP